MKYLNPILAGAIAIFIIVLAMFHSEANSQEKTGDIVPAFIVCKTPESFEYVIMEEDQKLQNAIASMQLQTGHCQSSTKPIPVKLMKHHHTFTKEHLMFKVYQVHHAAGETWYTIVVSIPKSAASKL